MANVSLLRVKDHVCSTHSMLIEWKTFYSGKWPYDNKPDILSYALGMEYLTPLGMTDACASLQDSNPPASVRPLATGSSIVQRPYAVCAFPFALVWQPSDDCPLADASLYSPFLSSLVFGYKDISLLCAFCL